MDIKDILSQSKTWMIVCSIITLFMLGIGPMTVSSEGIANMAEDAFGDMYTNATVEDKGTIEESVKEDAYFFGAANVSLAVFILGFAFLTEGKTRAKSAIFSGGALILWSIYSQGDLDVEAITFYTIVSVPMMITGYMEMQKE